MKILNLALKSRILGKLVASFVIIMTIMSLLANGNHSYNPETINILMLILGSAVTLLFSRQDN